MPFITAHKIKTVAHISGWTIYAIVYMLSMYPIVAVDFWILSVDAVIHSVLLAGIGFILHPVLQHGKYETMTSVQRIINYATLALLTIGFWIGAGYLINYLIIGELSYVFIPVVPVKMLIGILIFIIFVLFLNQRSKNAEQYGIDRAEPEIEPEPEIAEPELVEPDSELVDRIVVKDKHNIHLIPLNEIVCIKSYGDYVQIITTNGKYLKEKTMKYCETHLPKNKFVRIHRSYIINIEYISRIESAGNRNQQIALKTGEWLNISASGYKILKSALNL